MSELDNLNAAVASLQTAATAIEAAIAALKSGQIDPAQVQAAADAINAVVASLNTATQ